MPAGFVCSNEPKNVKMSMFESFKCTNSFRNSGQNMFTLKSFQKEVSNPISKVEPKISQIKTGEGNGTFLAFLNEIPFLTSHFKTVSISQSIIGTVFNR